MRLSWDKGSRPESRVLVKLICCRWSDFSGFLKRPLITFSKTRVSRRFMAFRKMLVLRLEKYKTVRIRFETCLKSYWTSLVIDEKYTKTTRNIKLRRPLYRISLLYTLNQTSCTIDHKDSFPVLLMEKKIHFTNRQFFQPCGSDRRRLYLMKVADKSSTQHQGARVTLSLEPRFAQNVLAHTTSSIIYDFIGTNFCAA